MCGLVGIAGKIEEKEKKAFRDMLVMDQVRGFDSTGVLSVTKGVLWSDKPVLQLEKEVGAAQNLWEFGSDIFTFKGVAKKTTKVLLGHNRAATVGKVTKTNAHPFQFGDITGAHNGSLRYWSELADADSFTVDSEAIFNDINKNGVDHTWKSFFGAAALTYWDNEKQQLSLIRNAERPLVYVWSADKKTLFWASELWMIQGAAWRHKIDLESNKAGATLYTTLAVDTLLTFDVSWIDIKKVGERELEKKPVPKSTGTASKRGQAGTKTGGDTTGIDLKGFKAHKSWRDGSTSFDGDIDALTLTTPRLVVRGNSGEWSFRLTVCKTGRPVGELDLYPVNKMEAKKYLRIITQTQAGVGYSFSFTGNPRVRAGEQNSNFKRYVSSPSVIKAVRSNVVTKIHPRYINRRGEQASFEEVRQDIKSIGGCCSYCDKNLYVVDSPKFLWLSSSEVLCHECSEDWGGNLHKMFG